MAYSVDILYNAIDNSRTGTLSFVKQLESVDRAVSQVAGKAGGGGGADAEATPGRLDSFSGLPAYGWESMQ
jgi:hypothetical protein